MWFGNWVWFLQNQCNLNISWLLICLDNTTITYYNIAFVNSECWLAKSRVDITLCQHGKFPATLLLKFFVLYYKRNIKHFIRVDIQLYQHEWKLEKREIGWKHDARRAECFHTISRFSNFHEWKCFIFLKCNIDVKGAKYQSNSNSLDYILQVAEHWASISMVIHVGSIPWQTWYEYTIRVTTTASKFCIIFPCCKNTLNSCSP